ncbi:hypothetical protein [Pirellulimonas nuda]|uniref:hypothetical protein n=1 Tax=Pirellulimonas nuda TaxID=2528009 RepID=UPI0011A3E078|nr:hypothetical protein [Pirellulimonas nuda]
MLLVGVVCALSAGYCLGVARLIPLRPQAAPACSDSADGWGGRPAVDPWGGGPSRPRLVAGEVRQAADWQEGAAPAGPELDIDTSPDPFAPPFPALPGGPSPPDALPTDALPAGAPPTAEALPAPAAGADQALPLGPGRMLLPLAPAGELQGTVEVVNGAVTIAVRDAPLHTVLSLLAQQQGLSIVASSDLTQPVTVTLQPTTLENALDALLAVADCTWTRRNDVIYVTSVSKDSTSSPFFQGREVRVFTLNYTAAADVETVVAGLLSPVGKVFIREIDSKDRRKTAEQVVIEDLPPFLDRAAEYIAQADQMPQQVMIEARILQVKLSKDKAHGVNFDAIAQLSGFKLQLWEKGFATDGGPGMVFTIDGSDFNGLIDCLTSTNDAKTLASPKVSVVNGQQSRIQIGRRLGYFVTTTTQTSTLQDVQFLELGVVLLVTPHITADGQVLMQVQPKVSSGDINPTTTLPEEETTELETSVLLPNGRGIVIGGLIQEKDFERQSKLMFLGDLWGVGHLFQRRTVDRERNEVIVAILPRIVGCGVCPPPSESIEVARSHTPLLTAELDKAERPWEPRLRDASTTPHWWAGHPVIREPMRRCPPIDGGAEEALGLPEPAPLESAPPEPTL